MHLRPPFLLVCLKKVIIGLLKNKRWELGEIINLNRKSFGNQHKTSKQILKEKRAEPWEE